MNYFVTYIVIGVLLAAFSAGVASTLDEFKDKELTLSGAVQSAIVFGLIWPLILVYAIGITVTTTTRKPNDTRE